MYVLKKWRRITQIQDLGFLQKDPFWLQHVIFSKILTGFGYSTNSLNAYFRKNNLQVVLWRYKQNYNENTLKEHYSLKMLLKWKEKKRWNLIGWNLMMVIWIKKEYLTKKTTKIIALLWLKEREMKLLANKQEDCINHKSEHYRDGRPERYRSHISYACSSPGDGILSQHWNSQIHSYDQQNNWIECLDLDLINHEQFASRKKIHEFVGNPIERSANDISITCNKEPPLEEIKFDWKIQAMIRKTLLLLNQRFITFQHRSKRIQEGKNTRALPLKVIPLEYLINCSSKKLTVIIYYLLGYHSSPFHKLLHLLP